MILTLVAVNHFVACGWFATSQLPADVIGGRNWVTSHEFQDEDWKYQYATSFHWAITQFTPSSMSVQPTNLLERNYAITLVVFGLVGFSYLVGSITGSLTELRRIKEEAVKQFWNLRRFLKKSQVAMPLRIRIEKYLEHAWQIQKNSMNVGSLPILRLLTEQLRNELNCAMSMPHLEVHPLFKYLSTNAPVPMQRIATKALSRKLLARGESVFQAGEIATHLSFVVRGRLQYYRTFRDRPDHKEIVDADEDWITEPAFWAAQWVTLGTLSAISVSEFLDVASAEFADAIKKTPQVYERICIYATNFITWLNGQDPKEQSDICQGDQIRQDIALMLRDEDEEEDEDEFGERTSNPFKHSGTKTRLSLRSAGGGLRMMKAFSRSNAKTRAFKSQFQAKTKS